ncbi:MAG: ATP-binding protein [Candidatus Acidiferrum sp.]
MHWLLYLRLIVLTAGTLLPFFWMVVILGHRRQRNFERVFFFLCLALTCFFGSSLLALNAELYYGTPPQGLLRFAWTFLCLGLWFIPPLVVHLHAEYASIRVFISAGKEKVAWLLLAWLPALLLSPLILAALRSGNGFQFETPSRQLGLPFQVWLVAAVAVGAYWQRRFAKTAPNDEQRAFHARLEWDLEGIAFWLLMLFWWTRHPGVEVAAWSSVFALLLALAPLGLLIGKVQRFNFLQIGRQRNLIYAVFIVFVALLYLSFVRRASLWLEPFLPPEATAALLLFLPVVFLEPLQRMMRRLLRQTAQTEVDRAQKLMGPINEVARIGDQSKLEKFSEQWIAEELQLAEVQLKLDATGDSARSSDATKSSSTETFEIRRGERHIGSLHVRSHGAMISGETYAALEFLCEQLPAAFDLCRLIEEKLQLERELAERERMALVGQMAASISHNLKNPLGSIKTILQVQMESAELPAALRGETQMVLDEINRLSAKLNQLLQFSRPGVRPSNKGDHCNIVSVAVSIAEVLCREADSSGVSLDLSDHPSSCEVAASAEAVNDILSNIILNAIEAVGRSGRVTIGFHCELRACTVAVEDNGPGLTSALREKILQPFFTTKPRGTGLGLAIVTRRLEELGGKLEIDSPLRDNRGSRFSVTLPLATKETQP